MSARFGWVRGVLAAAAVLGLVAAVVSDRFLAIVVVPALIGGAALAGALFFLHKRRALSHLEDATDVPTSARLEAFNTNSVTPAGIGGIGFGAMAVWVALQYPQGQALLLLGLVGGIGIAAALIAARRRPVRAQRVFPNDRR